MKKLYKNGNTRYNVNANQGEKSRFQVMFTPSAAWHNYDILDTNYDDYSIAYSCQELGFGILKFEYAWILMREPHCHDSVPFEEIEEKGIEVLKKKVPSYDINRLVRNPA